MTRTSIIVLCIFCLIMAGVITIAGYSTYDEYRTNRTYQQMGEDILGEADENIAVITDTVTWVKNKLDFDIGIYFKNLWYRIKNVFIEAFDWIPGVDADTDDNEENDFGTSGSGFGVPESNGFGGGSGGAR